MSRKHARIRVDGDQLTLSHLSRTNPTHLNGKIVRAGDPATLRERDRIVLSTNVLLELRRRQ